jgi:hypothetical protein
LWASRWLLPSKDRLQPERPGLTSIDAEIGFSRAKKNAVRPLSPMTSVGTPPPVSSPLAFLSNEGAIRNAFIKHQKRRRHLLLRHLGPAGRWARSAKAEWQGQNRPSRGTGGQPPATLQSGTHGWWRFTPAP